MDDEDFLDGYHGRLESVPDTAFRAARIYVCSTADFDAEKTILMKHSYSKLRIWCREKFDINFEV